MDVIRNTGGGVWVQWCLSSWSGWWLHECIPLGKYMDWTLGTQYFSASMWCFHKVTINYGESTHQTMLCLIYGHAYVVKRVRPWGNWGPERSTSQAEVCVLRKQWGQADDPGVFQTQSLQQSVLRCGFAAILMDLGMIILSEASQTEKDNIIWYHLHVDSNKKWYKWTYLQNRNRLTDFEIKCMVTKGEACGEVVN